MLTAHWLWGRGVAIKGIVRAQLISLSETIVAEIALRRAAA